MDSTCGAGMKENNRELLFSITKKDFDVQRFKSGGKGGQHQNTCDSGVRIIHRSSGAVGESRSERSQHQNKKIAFKRLADSQKFKLWLNKKIFELSVDEKKIKREVDLMMKEGNLKIEGKENNRWVDIEGE